MDTKTQVSKDEVLVSREGPIVTLTFNRPEARNAMTWGMYQRLYEVCEEVDADDSIRVLVLKGAGGKAFVAGTDISQFTKFKDGEDGIKYEKDGDKRSGRIARGEEAGDRADRGRMRRRRLRHRRGRRHPHRHARRRASACRPRARSATASR